jgi:hypothetical protein
VSVIFAMEGAATSVAMTNPFQQYSELAGCFRRSTRHSFK